MFVHKNAEGYPDPTVGEAMSNIAQEERRNQRPYPRDEGLRGVGRL